MTDAEDAGLPASASGVTAIADTESRQAQSGAALVVEAVDRRLTAVSQLGWDDPRVLDEYGTVVLSARPEPYGLGDLIARGAVRQDDASTFTLERSVVVRAGARLQIDAPGATLRLRSDEAGFADLVGWGGSIALNSADGAPLTVTSWDGTHSSADILTHDGRAFVLVRNGRFETAHTSFNKLGFWSGRTGGVAVVSTDIGLATAALTATAHTGLAYGVFLSGVVDSTVTGATVTGAELTGIHITGSSRNIAIAGATINGTGADAITIERGSSQVRVTGSAMAHAGGYGLRFSGQALADGPSPSGGPTTLATGLLVDAVTATDNDRGGILIDAGNDVILTGVVVDGASTALTVRGPSHTLAITGAALTASRDIPARISGAVSDAVLARSTLIGSETAASTTDARIAITENTFAVREGTPLTLGGRAHGVVERNTFNGTGQDPIGVADTALAEVDGSVLTDWRFQPEFVRWLNQHPMAWLWLLVLIVPAVGVPFVFARRKRQAELRALLEDAIIRYGRAKIADYAATDDGAPASEPSSTPAATDTLQAPAASSTPPRSGAGPSHTPASSATHRHASGHNTAPPHQTPRSLQALRTHFEGRDFRTMNEFAVAAVLEAGYPVTVIARLFRVPPWRIEDWGQQTLREYDHPPRR